MHFETIIDVTNGRQGICFKHKMLTKNMCYSNSEKRLSTIEKALNNMNLT